MVPGSYPAAEKLPAGTVEQFLWKVLDRWISCVTMLQMVPFGSLFLYFQVIVMAWLRLELVVPLLKMLQ
jgi:hypothetical protein